MDVSAGATGNILQGGELPSYLANKTIGMVTGVRLHDYGCPLKAITAEVAHELKYYGEMRRFLGALVVQVGRSVVDVQVNHRSRMVGKSRYSVLRLIGHYFDFIVSFSTRPFQIIGVVGGLLALLGFVGGTLYFPLRFLADLPLGGEVPDRDLPGGLLRSPVRHPWSVGRIYERIYRLVQNRPFYVIREILE